MSEEFKILNKEINKNRQLVDLANTRIEELEKVQKGLIDEWKDIFIEDIHKLGERIEALEEWRDLCYSEKGSLTQVALNEEKVEELREQIENIWKYLPSDLGEQLKELQQAVKNATDITEGGGLSNHENRIYTLEGGHAELEKRLLSHENDKAEIYKEIYEVKEHTHDDFGAPPCYPYKTSEWDTPEHWEIDRKNMEKVLLLKPAEPKDLIREFIEKIKLWQLGEFMDINDIEYWQSVKKEYEARLNE